MQEMQRAKRLTTNKCKDCGRKYNPQKTFMGVCPICQRKIFYDALPESEKEIYILDVVKKRYINAKLDDLGQALKEKLCSCEKDGAYIYGFPGVGKTYALAAVASYYLQLGYDVKRIGYERLCLKIRDTFKPQSINSEQDVIQQYLDADILIIEDLSTTVSFGRQESDFALRVVLLILDSRMEDCLPTFISGNKPPKELENAFDLRVVSRLRLGKIIRLMGKDRRNINVENKTNL